MALSARATPPPQTPSPSSPGDPVFRQNSASTTSAKRGAAKAPMNPAAPSRRRPLRKDRHSKIFTARGPRDRRMRLSLDVARKFFDLQDMLGFDKASKTVDWLLTNATTSIKELAGCSSPAPHATGKSESSTSECEVISTVAPPSTAPPPAKTLRKGATQSAPSRESRVLARARARERTREKMGQKGVDYLVQKKLDGGCKGSSMELMGEEAAISNPAGPIPVFDYSGNLVSETVAFAQEQWSLQSSGSAEEQRVLLPDAQLMPWFWDPFSNPSI